MKTLFSIIFSSFFLILHAQQSENLSIEPEVERELFEMHMPLILVTQKVTKKVITDGHEGGSAYYINVGEFEELASRGVFYTRGIQSYAMTIEQLQQINVENYLLLDDVKNHGETTEYRFYSKSSFGKEIGISATIINDNEKDDGPELGELHALEMDKDFKTKED